MTRKLRLLLICALLPVTSAFAASAKSYQVTGPIVALTPTTITVQKGDETWEIARDADAKGDPALKVGDQVTIHYRMHVTKIEAKGGAADDAKKADRRESPAKKRKGA